MYTLENSNSVAHVFNSLFREQWSSMAERNTIYQELVAHTVLVSSISSLLDIKENTGYHHL